MSAVGRDRPLEGKVAVVTAGGAGIGRAIAISLATAGASTVVCDISTDSLSGFRIAHPDIDAHIADVGDLASTERFFALVMERWGTIDILVNNAGVAGPVGAIDEIAPNEWEQTLRVNLTGVFNCTRQVAPVMRRASSGAIINLSTASTRTAPRHRSAYIASKAGVEGITRATARELGPWGVRCNAILPGPVRSPRAAAIVTRIAAEKGMSLTEVEADLLRFTSMRSWIEPEEIGNLAVFLGSNLARHISGQLISICGNAEWEE